MVSNMKNFRLMYERKYRSFKSPFSENDAKFRNKNEYSSFMLPNFSKDFSVKEQVFIDEISRTSFLIL